MQAEEEESGDASDIYKEIIKKYKERMGKEYLNKCKVKMLSLMWGL
jgi:hypothetical protein